MAATSRKVEVIPPSRRWAMRPRDASAIEIPVASPLRVVVSDLARGERVLDEATSRYVVRVHRLRAGDPLALVDPGAGMEADASLLDANPRAARCRVDAPRPAQHRSPLAGVLLQALGKGDKPESVIKAATALGVRSVEFVHTERSVPKLGERSETRLRRWREIALQAARQSGRGDVPIIAGPRPLAAALSADDLPRGPRLVLAPDAELPLLAALGGWSAEQPAVLLVGPEGGLSSEELALAAAAGFVRVRFGPLVLRTETAATAALGALLGLADARRGSPAGAL